MQNLHWVTDRQLLDAVSIGQFTPGPVFTTATFIGYLLRGWPAALLAALAMFLPSFVFIALIHQWPHVCASPPGPPLKREQTEEGERVENMRGSCRTISPVQRSHTDDGIVERTSKNLSHEQDSRDAKHWNTIPDSVLSQEKL